MSKTRARVQPHNRALECPDWVLVPQINKDGVARRVVAWIRRRRHAGDMREPAYSPCCLVRRALFQLEKAGLERIKSWLMHPGTISSQNPTPNRHMPLLQCTADDLNGYFRRCVIITVCTSSYCGLNVNSILVITWMSVGRSPL